MSNAKLYVIRGNCGCDSELTFRTEEYGFCVYTIVYISCGNGGTLHDLSDTVEEKK